MRDPDFRLLAFLVADVRHFRALIEGKPEKETKLRLFISMFSPRFTPVVLCRIAHGLYCLRLKPLAKLISLTNFIVFGIEIAVRCRIGKGLVLPHTQGTVIGAASIGENAIIFQGVTIGSKDLDISYAESRRPFVGNGVLVGAGAKVLGPIRIGDGVKIGANAVVLESLPDGVVAVGVPARILSPSPTAK